MRKPIHIEAGRPLPSGAYHRHGGVNFSLFSRHATRVWLELFDRPEDAEPAVAIELDPNRHRTGDMWHVWIKGITYGQLYAFRVDGPYAPQEGLRFNSRKLLLDPYTTALSGTSRWDLNRALGFESASPLKDLVPSAENNAGCTPKCLLTDYRFDWDGERPLKYSWSDTIVYETHVRGLTIHPSSGVKHPGVFLGVIEKIPYFKELGVTALELMPVQEFNEKELELRNPFTGELLRNYWGYSTVAFFAPKESYGTGKAPGCQIPEFKKMVRELHKAGIEVILDIVLNHTAEGSELGPTLNFRGIANNIYYMLQSDRRHYRNYSGCGNTINCNHPVVRSYILDCLRYWVIEMHVDGFRFDLASVLGRDEKGNVLANPPLLETIAEDPILRDVKLIAEAWDAGGAYQVGSFPGQRWSEWNGRFRDDIRRFWKGEAGMAPLLATRICGSADLYQRNRKEPINSINFITCHDGFTLNDLVSYHQKHNEVNGEHSRDGENVNHSDNYGVEGETGDRGIEAVRLRQIKNMTATLLISRGVPMILGGDEFRRTQRGNNNAYCQDNEASWYNWTLLNRNYEVFRFVREMIGFRKRHRVLRTQEFYTPQDILWFNPGGRPFNWDKAGRTLGCMIRPQQAPEASQGQALCLLFNAETGEVGFKLPSPSGGERWQVAVDTARPSPYDIREAGREELLIRPDSYRMQPRSMVILVSK
jgi:isoamylase